MRDFRGFVAGNDLMDLGYEGYPFTWRNNRESLPIQQRLDHGLVTHGWHDLYPDTIIRHVVLEGSDHAMLLLSTEKFRVWRGRKFSFDGRWSKTNECRELVVGEWKDKISGSHAYRFYEKIKTLRKSLKLWYKENSKNSKKKVEHLKAEIRVALQSKEFSSEAFKQKERDLRAAHKDEGVYWKVKSRNQWLKEDDKNTKFFHAQMLKRRRLNLIRGIEDSHGEWHEEDKEINETAIAYFAKLFQSSRPSQIDDIVRNVEARITPEDNNVLTAPVTTAEIVLAVSQIPPSRAPGLDGILVNGTPTGCIVPQKGLRQGDPLSPFLFLLCTEGLSMLLRKGLEQGALHGFKFTPNGTPLTHLFFADDSVVFGNATVDDARAVVEALKVYARGSGQEINLTKSSVFFSPKTSNRTKMEIEETLGIQCKQGFGKYLGLQADFGHSKKAIFTEVRDKVEARLAGWTEQFLSQAGKEVLIKSVAMALPNYAMSCFKLPIRVCKDMEKAIRNFWWKGNEQRKGVH
ncbi:hypothetical protein EV2_019583 [Malus domestica]